MSSFNVDKVQCPFYKDYVNVAYSAQLNPAQFSVSLWAKAAALSAEQALAQKKQESSDLEAKLEAKKAELEKVKKEKELVLQRLEQKNSGM